MSSYINNLKAIVQQLQLAEHHLKTSYQRCKKVGLAGPHQEEEMIEFEALTGRFARLVDLLVNKFFRSVDVVEMVDSGTLIDVVNRAEKRGMISSAKEIRLLKDLRNDIAHEYLAEKVTELHKEVYSKVPYLLECVSSSLNYAERYLSQA